MPLHIPHYLSSRLPLLFILITAAFFRFYQLDTVPSGLHNDEASFFLNAISLYETGMDEDGQRFPLFLRSIADPKPAVFSYLQIPFLAAFGQSTAVARTPGSLLGIFSILLIYTLIIKMNYSLKFALLVAGLLAVSPWHIFISRSTHEVILSFVLLLLGLLVNTTILHSTKLKILPLLFLSLLSLAAGYVYHTAKIIFPLAIAVQALAYKSSPKKILVIIGAISTSLLILLLHPYSWTRFKAINVFGNDGPYAILTNQITIGTGHTSPLLLRALHNKPLNYSLTIASNYLKHFTADFFIFNGGEPVRYKIPHQGLLYVVELPLLIIGLAYIIRKKITNNNKAMLSWILISPIAASLTVIEVPSSIRTAFMMVPIYVGIAYGIKAVNKYKFTLPLIIGGYLFGVVYFWHQYSIQATYYQPWHRDWVDEQLVKQLKQIDPKYRKVVIAHITGDTYQYFALNDLITLQAIQSSYPLRTEKIKTWDKYHFDQEACPYGAEPNTLYAVNYDCPIPLGYTRTLIGRIPFADGNHGYALYEYQQKPNFNEL